MSSTRIWRGNVYGPDGCRVVWGLSSRQVLQRGQDLAAQIDGTFEPQRGTQPVDLDLTREGLVQWLNLHFTTDNG